jgi:peptide/nickel transport system permease protein
MRAKLRLYSFRVAAGWLVGLVLIGTLASWLPLPWQATQLDLAYLTAAPSARHWLGTDVYGRDVTAQLAAGTRNLLLISLPAAALASAIGLGLGAAAGYWGKQGPHFRLTDAIALAAGILVLCLLPVRYSLWVAPSLILALAVTLRYAAPRALTFALPIDGTVQTLMLLLGAVPRLALVLALASLPVPRFSLLPLLLGFTSWPTTARLTRAAVRLIRTLPHVEAAKSIGLPTRQLVTRHILRNAWPVILSAIPMNLSMCVALQTTLAFLGVGLPPESADWGNMLILARQEPGAWWLILFPASALALTLVSLRLIAKFVTTRSNKGEYPLSQVTNKCAQKPIQIS